MLGSEFLLGRQFHRPGRDPLPSKAHVERASRSPQAETGRPQVGSVARTALVPTPLPAARCHRGPDTEPTRAVKGLGTVRRKSGESLKSAPGM